MLRFKGGIKCLDRQDKKKLSRKSLLIMGTKREKTVENNCKFHVLFTPLQKMQIRNEHRPTELEFLRVVSGVCFLEALQAHHKNPLAYRAKQTGSGLTTFQLAFSDFQASPKIYTGLRYIMM